MTTAEAWRAYVTANRRARFHYRTENHCVTCGAPRPFHLTRQPVRCDECRKENP